MSYTYKNFAFSTVLTAPSPALSGTSLVVQSGDGTKFSNGYAVVWPPGVQPLVSNAEIVLITAIATDTLTITRTQEGSTNQSIAVGWQVDQGITAGLLAQYAELSGATFTGPIAMSANKITGLANGSVATDVAAFGQIPAAATTVTGPDAYGAAAVVGTGTSYARDDHDHGLPAAPAASLTLLTGTQGASITLPFGGTLTTLMTTASLAIGVWELYAGLHIKSGAPATASAYGQGPKFAVGTATATFLNAGNNVLQPSVAVTTSWYYPLVDTTIVTITVAGTIVINSQYTDTANNATAYDGIWIAKKTG